MSQVSWSGHTGACLAPPDNCWLLCEYLPGGTLSHWLAWRALAGWQVESLPQEITWWQSIPESITVPSHQLMLLCAEREPCKA